MAKLEYTFKNDTLFKMLFVQYQDLLQRLVADLLGIRIESIKDFAVTNPEMPPDVIGDKFCRLDINMTVDGQRVDLEIVVTADGGLKLWLALFNAETEEDLAKIEALEVPVMEEAIKAYRHVATTGELREIERLRSRTRHNEASALRHARDVGEKIGAEREREKWQGVVDEQALVVEKQAALIAQLQAKLGIDK